MRKVESTRALCDYYNEIVYKVNKLTEMCGNTPEAIKLRDDIDDMFTVKFSEPLDDIAELQEQIGCPLEIVFKAIKQGYVWTKDNTTNRTELKYDTKANDFYWNWNFDCYFKNYKKTWWLKKDKSE